MPTPRPFRAALTVLSILLCSVFLWLLIHQGRFAILAGRIAIGVNVLALAFLVRKVWKDPSLRKLTAKGTVGAIAALGATAYLFILAFLYFAQDRLLYVPVAGKFADCKEGTRVQRPGFRGFALEKPGAAGWVISFHGNAESACRSVVYGEFSRETPMNWLFVEYPGYLDDDVKSSQDSILKAAELAYDEAASRNPRSLPIFAFGRSLGTGVATYLASTRKVAGVILVSPYTSIVDVAANEYPFIPVRWLLHDSFPAFRWAKDVRAPVLVIHGDEDRLIPLEMGRQEAGNFAKAEVHVVPGANHNNVLDVDADRTRAAFTDFVNAARAR